jgi:argininosuccinate lyase
MSHHLCDWHDAKGLCKQREKWPCRSRNDQVVTDYRLWLLKEVGACRSSLRQLIAIACDRAEAEADVLMPGFTHLQPAQTIRWGHWIMCHCSGWQRDDQRLRDLTPRVSMLPLGSGALAGNPFGVDRDFLAQVSPSQV